MERITIDLKKVVQDIGYPYSPTIMTGYQSASDFDGYISLYGGKMLFIPRQEFEAALRHGYTMPNDKGIVTSYWIHSADGQPVCRHKITKSQYRYNNMLWALRRLIHSKYHSLITK